MLDKLPHNIEAEKAVLGAIFSSREALIEASSALVTEDFYDRRHQKIFDAILSVQDKHNPVELQTITAELINRKELEEIGGVPFLFEIRDSSIALSSVNHYIDIVKEQAVLRNYLLQIKNVLEDYDKEEIDDVSEFIGRTGDSIMKKAESRKISSFETAAEVAARVRIDLNTIKVSDEDGVTGIPTGYKRLNMYTHGFQKSDMIILAARPSVGKTAFGLNLCMNAALKTKKPVAIFSLEMPSSQLILRLLANRSCVDLGKIQTGKMSTKEYCAVDQAIQEISATKIYIDDTPGIKLMDILSKARKLKMEQPDLCFIMIDYIGLITTGNKKVESRQVEVSEISRALKALARELQLPILVICQLSRAVDARNTKKPMLSDLRESGSIEQDADQVMLIYREDYYTAQGIDVNKKTDQNDQGSGVDDKGNSTGLVEISIAKNRNGQIGEIQLVFTKNIGRFDDPATDFEEDQL